MMTDEWLEELKKHPFISSMTPVLNFIERHGKGIFLMKSRAKTIRKERQQKYYPIGVKMSVSERFEESKNDNKANVVKRKKLNDGTAKDVNMQGHTPQKG